MSRSTTQPGQPQLRLETLEAREVPALIIPPRTTPPDHAGGTTATAAVVAIPEMGELTVSDYLPSSSDIDYYKVHLDNGDFFSASLKSTGSSALNGTLAVYDSSSHLVTQSSGTATRFLAVSPSVGFYADQGQDYFLRVTTSGANAGTARRYDLDLGRVGIIDTASPKVLDQGGTYHAWLNKSGDTLAITGPSGYGFSLRGKWTQTVSGDTATYVATGTLYLKTAALASAGEIALQVPSGQTFSVSTHVAGRMQFGELAKVTGNFGLSLAPVAGAIKDTFGLDVSSLSVMSGWTIKTGAQIKQQYQSYVQRDIDQLLDGVPYLVYGNAGKVKINFGQVSLATTDQAKTVLIADPADPFLYVAYKNYAAAGSTHGRIPFNTTLTTPDDSLTVGGPILGEHTEFYGHVYAAGSFPISGLPMTVNGDVTVDLDANQDGQYIGGAGSASDLFRGDLRALENVARDINVGINGGVNVGYTVAGVNVSVPVGQGSAFYSGPKEAIFFEGKQGTALNPWAGTILSNFQVGPGAAIEGYAYRDGRFSVSTASNYRVFGFNAALTLTVTDHDISADGQLKTPIGSADISGSMGFNGDFTWTGDARIGIGGGGNYIRGDAGFTLTKVGSSMTFDANLDCNAKLSIPGVKAQGSITGHLKVKTNSQGQITYDTGSLSFSGGVYVYNPIVQKWNKIGSASAAVTLSGKKLGFHACGHSFSITLP